MTLLLSVEPDWHPVHGVEERVVNHFHRIIATEGMGALAVMIENALDERSGRWNLTEEEKYIRTMCRSRFGIYDPSSMWQVRFIDAMRWESQRKFNWDLETDLDELITGLSEIAGDYPLTHGKKQVRARGHQGGSLPPGTQGVAVSGHDRDGDGRTEALGPRPHPESH